MSEVFDFNFKKPDEPIAGEIPELGELKVTCPECFSTKLKLLAQPYEVKCLICDSKLSNIKWEYV